MPLLWLQFTAGRGPGECQLAIAPLVACLQQEAAQVDVTAKVLDLENGPEGLLSALVALNGKQATTLAASWEGTIQWTCPSPIRPGWKRKNWFVACNIIRPPSASETIRESDLKFEACRASGPGGQHVNKTNSAIRVTHLPTGLVAQAQEERSQQRNKALAVARLTLLLAAKTQEAGDAKEREKWSKHDEVERGNPVRVYQGLEFKRKV